MVNPLAAAGLALALISTPHAALAQSAQNPSPMVEHTRAHPRLKPIEIKSERHRLSLGTLTVPTGLVGKAEISPLLIHFHGANWIADVAAASIGSASLAVNLGSGSTAYAKPFRAPARFRKLLAEAEAASGTRFAEVTLSGWSAGCGAIREILKSPDNDTRIAKVILIDGIHTGYPKGSPGPLESEIDPAPLAPLLRFARLATAGEKTMIVTHSEIFPGTYASTTETADWMLRELDLRRRAILKWGPMQTQQLSECRSASFYLAGFAGNSAPDHVDQLHSLPDLLHWPPEDVEAAESKE